MGAAPSRPNMCENANQVKTVRDFVLHSASGSSRDDSDIAELFDNKVDEEEIATKQSRIQGWLAKVASGNMEKLEFSKFFGTATRACQERPTQVQLSAKQATEKTTCLHLRVAINTRRHVEEVYEYGYGYGGGRDIETNGDPQEMRLDLLCEEDRKVMLQDLSRGAANPKEITVPPSTGAGGPTGICGTEAVSAGSFAQKTAIAFGYDAHFDVAFAGDDDDTPSVESSAMASNPRIGVVTQTSSAHVVSSLPLGNGGCVIACSSVALLLIFFFGRWLLKKLYRAQPGAPSPAEETGPTQRKAISVAEDAGEYGAVRSSV
ncbi:unnamed protein product [Amoebophrya sp. A25]|nr:unnamed protein product [Amoebophrya sp. A25]|eukprot:GSA25T00009232001.1